MNVVPERERSEGYKKKYLIQLSRNSHIPWEWVRGGQVERDKLIASYTRLKLLHLDAYHEPRQINHRFC